jgi:hypothetical protein
LQSWFQKVPGLMHEIELMVWTHRSQSPIMYASASDADVDGSTTQITMIPRSFWDEDPRFLDTFTAGRRSSRRDTDAFWQGIVFHQHEIRVHT